MELKEEITILRELKVLGKMEAFSGRQGNNFIVDNFINMTTSEPASHLRGDLVLSTVAGVGSVTGTQTFAANKLYYSFRGEWLPITLCEGATVYNKATKETKVFDGTALQSIGTGGGSGTTLAFYSVSGVESNTNTVAGINVAKIGSLVDSDALANAQIISNEVDPETMRSGNTVIIPRTGTYEVFGKIGHTVVDLTSAGAQNANATNRAGLRINGVPQWLDVDAAGGLPDRFNFLSTFQFSAGDTVELIYGASAETSEDYIVALNIQQLPTSTVVNASDLVTNDQANSGYMDVGNMRMQWGRTSGASAIESVTFPAPFKTGSLPTITFNHIGTTLRESAVNAISVTGATLESGVANVKMWQAIGLKP